MKFTINHCNINVQDIERSIEFYKKAFGLKVAGDKWAKDGSFRIVYMNDDNNFFRIELTWLRDHADRPYDLGENESHICFVADDYDAAHKMHEEMGVICFENHSMGLYFVEDPDGYWLEVVPVRK
ncbi:MAG: VOC family protein [Clostridia bacterium]|nr:VOC family protein [Clostridia bacterium]